MPDLAVSSSTSIPVAANFGVQHPDRDLRKLFTDETTAKDAPPARSIDRVAFSEEALNQLAAEEAKRAAAPGQNTT